MTDFFCYRCNAGPFSTDNPEFFRRCDVVHKQCGEHWRHYEKTMQDLATEFVEENHGEMQKRLKEFFGSMKNDIFEEVAKLLEKEVKDEHDNIIHVLITIFSAYTKTPQNLRILAPSGEGKTYIVNKVANLCPQDNIWMLANATPQSFKYKASKQITETSPGVWEDYNKLEAKIFDEAEIIPTKFGTMPKLTPAQKVELQQIKENTYSLLDFTNKTVIFLDSQSFQLFESLKTTLSHDREYNKMWTANKSSQGKISTSGIVFKGWPAVIYCSAKDEIAQDKTDEINTRFVTITIKGTKEKYRDMLKVKSYGASLPNSIYQKRILSDDAVNLVKDRIQAVIDNIQKYSEEKNPIVNFYGDAIADLFKDDAGYRVRQLSNLLSNITVITLARARARPKLVIDDRIYPMAIKQDIELACKITHEANPLPPTKLQFFNKYIRPAFIEKLDGKLTALDLANFVMKITPIMNIDRQTIREKYLDGFVNHGYLESEWDSSNASRYIYSLVPRYQSEEAVIETSLIVTSVIDDSCVNVFKEQWLSDVPRWKITDEDGKEILDIEGDVKDDQEYEKKQLLILLNKNVTAPPIFVPENTVKQVTESDGNVTHQTDEASLI